MHKSETRIDIQALRGYAVLIVVLYHAKLSFLPSGFLGVDVFFVISGFLITRLIKNGIERGDFSFSDFYFRRAKRLLPAAYVTFLATSLLAPLFLASPELGDLRAQVAGAVTFTGNIVLWGQSGYFAGSAELKPLLHIWSLAIEEQYYFFLPALLAFLPRRYWLAVVATGCVASLALCLALAGRGVTFYMLPTRAWELLIGSLGTLISLGAPGTLSARVLKFAFWPALAAVLAVPFCTFEAPHPGPAALLTCVATLALLLRKHPMLNERWLPRRLAWLGDRSYSLYLVHWPLFAFFNNVWLGKGSDEPLSARLGLIALSLLAAWLLHRYVEDPVRRADIKKTVRILMRTVATSLGIVALSASVAHAVTETRGTAGLIRENYGLSQQCAREDTRVFVAPSQCRNSDKPHILVWGDSFAMHLVPGLLSEAENVQLVQATRPVCGPFLSYAVVREKGGRPRSWAESCIGFNRSVLSYLKATPSIDIVVLSSPLDYMVMPEEHLLRRNADASYTLVPSGQASALAAFSETVADIHALGRRVVVVAPPPMDGLNAGRCQERLLSKLPILGVANDCSIEVDAYHHKRAPVLQLLAALPSVAGVDVIRFDSLLCDGAYCRTSMDGLRLYNDAGHLSREGMMYLAPRMALLESIEKQAR